MALVRLGTPKHVLAAPMTTKQVTAVLECRQIKGTELVMLARLARRADRFGRCDPSVRELAHDANLSRAQTQRVLHRLIEKGFIDVVANEFGGRPGSARQYEMRLDRLTTGRRNEAPVFDDTGRSLPAPLAAVGDALNPNEINSRAKSRLQVSNHRVKAAKPREKMSGPESARDLHARASIFFLARQGHDDGEVVRETEHA